MRLYRFLDEDKNIDVTLVTDGSCDQKKVFITESPRGITPKGNVTDPEGGAELLKLGFKWNVGEAVMHEELVAFAEEKGLELIIDPQGLNEIVAVTAEWNENDACVITIKTSVPAKKDVDIYFLNSVNLNESAERFGVVRGDRKTISTKVMSGKPMAFTLADLGLDAKEDLNVVVMTDNNTWREELVAQNASTVTYEYALTVDPTSVTFDGAGGEKLVTVTSTRTKVLNGVKQQAESYPTDIELAGEGFSYEVSGNNYNLKAEENTGTSQRTGKATISQEGGKTVQMNLTQNASTVTYEYALTANSQTIQFVALGETKSLHVVSTRQKKVNGKPSGDVEKVDTTAQITGTGFSETSSETTNGENYSIVAAENKAETANNGSITITQTGSNKTVKVTLTQLAAAGETKIFGVSSKKQKKVNGKNDGSPMTVDYTTVVSGTGFTKGSTEYSVVADANTGAQRTGTAVVTAVEGGKKATVNLTQLAGE